MGSPFSLLLLQRWPSFRRTSTYLGLVICATGLVASSFATRVWQVILTQGVLYAIGGGLLYHPLMVFIDEWFVRRKGLAFGVMWVRTFPLNYPNTPFLFPMFYSSPTDSFIGWHWVLRRHCPLHHHVGSLHILFSYRRTGLGRYHDHSGRSLAVLCETLTTKLSSHTESSFRFPFCSF